MMLASRLHSGSLYRCQRETGARQFIKWLKFFQEEDIKEIERTEKWEHYIARLIATVKGIFQKGVREQDQIIKFRVDETVPVKPTDEAMKEQRTKEAKSYWAAFFATHKAVASPAKKKKRKG